MANAFMGGTNRKKMTSFSRFQAALKQGVGRRVVSLLFLLGIIPLGLLTLVFSLFYMEAQIQGIKNVQKELAEGISSEISAYFARTEGQIQIFARMLDIKAQGRQGLKDLANGFLDQGHEYDVITMADLDGNEICKISRYYSFRDFELGNLALTQSFELAKRGERHISHIEISKFSKFPEIHITLPIIDFSDNLTGVLDVGVNVSKMWNLISKHRIGKNRQAYVVDDKGILIAYEDVSSVLQKKDLRHIPGVRRFLSGNAGVSQYRGLMSDHVIGASTRIPLTGWGVVVEEPVKDAFSDLYTLSAIILGISLVTIVSALFFGLRFSFKGIIEPIRRLQTEAQAIAKGELDVQIDMDRSDEIGQLAETFNAMVKDLKKTTVSRDLLIQEIHEREQAQEALRESESRFRLLFDNLSTCVAVYEAKDDGNDFVFADFNRAAEQTEGVKKEDLIGKSVLDVFPGVKEFGLFDVFRKVWKDGEATNHPISFYQDDRIVGWRENYVFKLPTGEVVAVYSDETKHKQVEEDKKRFQAQLQRAEKMEAIGTLAGGVAHDLNNILSGLVSYPELLLMDLPEDSPLRASVLTIQTSGKKAAAIVQDMLTLARRGVAVSEVLNLNDVVSEYLKSPEYERLRRFHPGVLLETRLEEGLLNVMGSPVHLSKTVMNLVSNAVEAIPDGGMVTVSTSSQYVDRPIRGYDEVKEGDYVVLTVTDNGAGIAPDDQEKIFEPFYTKKAMGRSGTGLGMAVVWGTVKDHEGYIDLKSMEGEGTTFELFFPITRKKAKKDSSSTSIETLMGRGETILVVDDVPEQRGIAMMLLTKLGYSVHAVSSGEEAIDYLKTNVSDLLILDMIMEPGIDGLDTYRKISEIHPSQKAIIASGFSETDRVKEAQRLGAGQYIRKPYTLEKIGLAVRNELQSP